MSHNLGVNLIIMRRVATRHPLPRTKPKDKNFFDPFRGRLALRPKKLWKPGAWRYCLNPQKRRATLARFLVRLLGQNNAAYHSNFHLSICLQSGSLRLGSTVENYLSHIQWWQHFSCVQHVFWFWVCLTRRNGLRCGSSYAPLRTMSCLMKRLICFLPLLSNHNLRNGFGFYLRLLLRCVWVGGGL